MRARQVGHHLGEQLEGDERAVQRVVVELVGAAEDVGKRSVVLVDVAAHQRLGEVALVLEVIEEAALGDADAGDQLVDRGCGEALLEHGGLGELEDAGRACRCPCGVRCRP